MKTLIFLRISLILLLFLFAHSLSAQDQTGARQQGNVDVQGIYTDKNNDGICDTYEVYGRGKGYDQSAYYGRGAGYGRGKGISGGPVPTGYRPGGYRQGLPQGQGRDYGPASGRGLGPGRGRGLSPGGKRFVDTNKNGICDTNEANVEKN